jgi:hypothetical protein
MNIPTGWTDNDDRVGSPLDISDESIERLLAAASTSIERDEGTADANFLVELSRYMPPPLMMILMALKYHLRH